MLFVFIIVLECIANIKVELAAAVIPIIGFYGIAPVDPNGPDWQLDTGTDADVRI